MENIDLTSPLPRTASDHSTNGLRKDMSPNPPIERLMRTKKESLFLSRGEETCPCGWGAGSTEVGWLDSVEGDCFECGPRASEMEGVVVVVVTG
jgi:hypothetical protein